MFQQAGTQTGYSGLTSELDRCRIKPLELDLAVRSRFPNSPQAPGVPCASVYGLGRVACYYLRRFFEPGSVRIENNHNGIPKPGTKFVIQLPELGQRQETVILESSGRIITCNKPVLLPTSECG